MCRAQAFSSLCALLLSAGCFDPQDSDPGSSDSTSNASTTSVGATSVDSPMPGSSTTESPGGHTDASTSGVAPTDTEADPDTSGDGGSSSGSPSSCGDTPGMVCVFAGEFIRGSDDPRVPSDEVPQTTIFLDEFEIDEFEVTVAEYVACFEAGACSEPGDAFGDGSDCNWMRAGLDEHPINCIDWFQADDYCTWADKRLPTEAEWEKAARGVDGRTHPWGEDEPTCNLAVMNDGGFGCGIGTPSLPVGSRSPDGDSPYGLKDAAGNVWEWVADWYDPEYYPRAPTENPMGPGNGTAKIVRGGGWINTHDSANTGLRMADRAESNPVNGSTVYGIRCARTPR
ncbi:MAG: SUMF1/EgtB/PvdO family nonheme iron enzyme [Myxococcota bacterium]